MENSGEDTICAIATPIGEGGVGIVRVSGDRAIAIASNIVVREIGYLSNNSPVIVCI